MKEILEQLNIKNPECIYLHFSVKGIHANIFDAYKYLMQIIDYFGPECSIFVPTYPHGIIAEYIAYLSQPVINYDSIHSICKLNLFGEFFRRRKDAYRSLNPIIPISGIGPLKREILSESHIDEYQFRENSSYQKLMKYNTYVLGIGLNSHTNVFIHVLDEILSAKLPYNLHSDKRVKTRVFENKEFRFEKEYYYLLPEIRRKERPEQLHELMKDESFYRFNSNLFDAYSLELAPFLKFGKELGDQAIAKGDLPIWHKPIYPLIL
jgi:aminoglycoside N3'-acetyltransferase